MVQRIMPKYIFIKAVQEQEQWYQAQQFHHLAAYGLGVNMTIQETIYAAYPELEGTDLYYTHGIKLQDDSDGIGVYVAEWNYSQPLPNGMKVGK
jgi:hypothetical protein